MTEVRNDALHDDANHGVHGPEDNFARQVGNGVAAISVVNGSGAARHPEVE